MEHSESAAWLTVINIAHEIRRGKKIESYDSRAAKQIISIAESMLAQLDTGMHKNPALLVGLNPRRRNPLPGHKLVAGDRISDRVYEIAYRHDEDGLDYKHEFKAGVELWTVTLGRAKCVVLSGKDKQDLWRDF